MAMSDYHVVGDPSLARPVPSQYAEKTDIEGTKTATGNPITVTDAAPINAVNLSMDLEPIQDLHGYDNPWVGGAGKNKLPMTVDGIKAANTIGTWSGNVYTYAGMTYEILINSDNNVTGIKVNGTTSNYPSLFTSDEEFMLPLGTYKIIANGVRGRLYKNWGTPIEIYANQSYTLTVDNVDDKYAFCIFTGATTITNVIAQPMIILSTETDSTFVPYTNICPISGRTEEVITQKDNPTNPTVTKTYTIQFGQTVYGGRLDVTRGKLIITDGYISSYNGETLPSTWISDRDKYESGATPTTGAEVVYKLATPIEIDLTPTQIKMLENTNTLYTDYEGDTIHIEYQPNNAIGEAVRAVEESYDAIIQNLIDRVTALENQ
jgi:hypothetical protein